MINYKNQTKDYRVGKTSYGLGLFANRDFIKEEFVIEYTGEPLTHEQADRKGGKYLFTLNDEIVLDGTDRKYTARYINHSCIPNIEAVIEEEKKIMFYTLRQIKKGEEFTFDYGEEYVENIISKKGCLCDKCTHKM
jgi:SET domain-containing protein